ncbi:MAG: DUF6152 family protein [Gammaproteobacteria bacterium]|nr:DUF6152 family protein [Gammaproteobacteria bacterium]MDH3506553.1 DUF6152 family protein [Gammaproteobacteria bacterium]
MQRLMRLIAALICLPTLATAHHSRAEFSEIDRELEGRLLEVQWRNPHPIFRLATVDDAGQEAEWRLEAYGNALTLQRTGLSADMFVVGDIVRVAGKLSKRRANVLLANHILLGDGREAVLEYESEPYFTEEHIGGSSSWVVDEEVLARAATENRGFFRVWSLPMRGLDREHSPFTEAAIAARASWDVLDNYLTRCEPGGMPHAMKNPQRYELVQGDGEIYIRSQFFNIERTIHMENAENPADQPASRLGYSVGRWEDENTLVVETSRINWPYFDTRGTPQTEDVEVFERFTLSEDQSRLDFHMTVSEPATFTEPATFDKYWLAMGGELLHYECVVE